MKNTKKPLKWKISENTHLAWWKIPYCLQLEWPDFNFVDLSKEQRYDMMKKEDLPEKGRTLSVDPNVPRWMCQNCRHYLSIVGADSYAEKYLNDSTRSG